MMYLLVFSNIILLVTGQALFKYGLPKVGGLKFDSFQSVLKVFLSPYILTGLFIYVIATVLWFYIISKYEISTVYPMQSLAYILMAILAILLFNETIGAYKWLGIILIVIGVIFVTR
jgi:drug/metabolite transporter (DMT)-like permease